MRYGPDDKFWVVVDPRQESTLDDIVFEASLRDLELQFKGGLTSDENPTLFTDRREARIEAFARLTVMQASHALLRAGRESPDARIGRVEIYAADGGLMFQAKFPQEAP